MELSKKDKKAARDVIELGLQREFVSGLSNVDAILQAWKTKAKDNKETYHQLYKHIITLDKHIAHRYDDITVSRYLLTIIGQMRDNVIHDEDLVEFSEEVQLYLRGIIKSF